MPRALWGRFEPLDHFALGGVLRRSAAVCRPAGAAAGVVACGLRR